MLINQLLVCLNSHLDVLSSIGVFQRIDSFLILRLSRTCSSNHHSFTVSSQWILQHSC